MRGTDIRAVGQALAQSMGYQLEDAAFEKEGPGVYLRFYLDKEGGITLDDCAAFHRKVRPLLENVPYDYLEVCSLGIDRPIKTVKQAQGALHQLVEVKLYAPLDGQKQLTGTLREASSQGYVVRVGDKDITVPLKAVAMMRRTIDVDEILEAHEEDTEEKEL